MANLTVPAIQPRFNVTFERVDLLSIGQRIYHSKTCPHIRSKLSKHPGAYFGCQKTLKKVELLKMSFFAPFFRGKIAGVDKACCLVPKL